MVNLLNNQIGVVINVGPRFDERRFELIAWTGETSSAPEEAGR